MKSNQIIQLIILFLGISSCHRQEREHKIENTNHVISKDSLPTKSIQPLNSINETDTIKYDYGNSPQNSALHINVLTTGVFHSFEINENADKQNWIGLFKNKTKFYLAETKMIAKRVNDGVLDAENEKTGWKVETINKDTSIILIEN